jgi:hypothetical protein
MYDAMHKTVAPCLATTTDRRPAMHKPSLGRVVIVHGLDPALNNGATEAPAVITRVWSDRCVNLQVLVDEANAPIWKTSVMLYDDDAAAPEGATFYATWPART